MKLLGFDEYGFNQNSVNQSLIGMVIAAAWRLGGRDDIKSKETSHGERGLGRATGAVERTEGPVPSAHSGPGCGSSCGPVQPVLPLEVSYMEKADGVPSPSCLPSPTP